MGILVAFFFFLRQEGMRVLGRPQFPGQPIGERGLLNNQQCVQWQGSLGKDLLEKETGT